MTRTCVHISLKVFINIMYAYTDVYEHKKKQLCGTGNI